MYCPQDPGHPLFLYRCESNPALYAQCTVLWMGEWRTSTMKQIPLLMDGIKGLITGKEGGEEGEERKDGENQDDDDDGEEEGKRGEGKSGSRGEEGKNCRGEGKRGEKRGK